MQTTNIRHKLGLFGGQIILVIILLSGLSQQSMSQGMNFHNLHLPAYDERELHYGFLIGAHVSNYRIQYNKAFTTAAFDSLHSVVPTKTGGFKLGFVIDLKLLQYLSLRATPAVSFYENSINYRFTNGTTIKETKDATLVELPILLKYRSVRRNNNRMYLLLGLSPVIESAGSKDENDTRERLVSRNFNVNLEFGVGTDIFYEFFKFAVEMRYSRGLRNLLAPKNNIYSAPLRRLSLHNVGLFITFEGGPS